VAATPATAHVTSVVVVTGLVTPHAAGPVVVQRLVGHTWKTVAHGRSARTGAYGVSLRAPRSAATWLLRVVRPATRTAKAATSRTARVHVVKAIFTVRSTSAPTVASGVAITVTGTVTPKAGGTVALQGLQHNVWHTLATARLTRSATFTFATTRPSGAYRLRVVKAFTAAIAAGTGKAFTVTVAPPVVTPPTPTPPPTISTTAIPYGTVGIHYAATLKAAGGVAPYTWSGSAVPAGLTLSAQGVLAGTPAAAAASLLTATVTDSLGHAAARALTLTIGHGLGFSWGDNMNDVLGDGTSNNSSVPVSVKNLTDVTTFAGGEDAAYALTATGAVWAWGNNMYGELGDSTTTNHSVAAQVPGLSTAKAIAAGSTAAYALLQNGTVWAWGRNSSGELGDNSTTQRNSPVQVSNLVGVTAIASGEDTAYALRNDGTVWAWGHNDDGQLGDGSLSGDSPVPLQVSGVSGVTAIAAGSNAAYALLGNGTVMAWGYNGSGQVGDNTAVDKPTPVAVSGLSGVTAIAGGSQDGYALKADGTEWAWGDGGYGQLGTGGIAPSLVPVEVSALAGVTAIAATNQNAFALLADGTAWGWGFNLDGEVGNGTLLAGLSPAKVSGLSKVVAIGNGPSSSAAYAVTSS
jgi:alpha-tubulin suppressor-like RCC1 family protein